MSVIIVCLTVEISRHSGMIDAESLAEGSLTKVKIHKEDLGSLQ